MSSVTPAALAGAVPLYVSLNEQDYRVAGSSNFTFHALPHVSGLAPVGGPRLGGTQVTVMGSGMAPGSVSFAPSLCKFGVKIVTAVVVPNASV